MVNGLKNGDGKYYFPSGDYYEGQFKNGKLHGLGKFIKQDGSFSFEGYWENGLKKGLGIQTVSKRVAPTKVTNTVKYISINSSNKIEKYLNKKEIDEF